MGQLLSLSAYFEVLFRSAEVELYRNAINRTIIIDGRSSHIIYFVVEPRESARLDVVPRSSSFNVSRHLQPSRVFLPPANHDTTNNIEEIQ